MPDIIVAGLGAVGSAAVYHLAGRGRRVVAFDRHAPPHPHGSSHGHSRIIRQAYFEGVGYVPLVLRAYELWETLERDAGQRLHIRTGGLMIGRADSEVVVGARRSAVEHGLDHEVLGPAAVASRFPAYRLTEDEVAVHERHAGALLPEDAISAHLRLAAHRGAELHAKDPVRGWEPLAGGGVAVTAASGRYEADRLVLTAGAWNDELSGAVLGTVVERQVPVRFRPRRPELFSADRMPVFVAERADGRKLYGLPDLHGEGVKVGIHHGGVTGAPDELDRTVSEDDVDAVRTAVSDLLPDVDGGIAGAEVCLYTNSKDRRFIIGRHPREEAVVVVAGLSGHGFKFSSVLGEIAADLATSGTTVHDVSPFDPARLKGTP